MHSLRGLGTFAKARSLSDVSEDVGLSDSEGGIEDKCLDITRNHGFLMLSALLVHFEFWYFWCYLGPFVPICPAGLSLFQLPWRQIWAAIVSNSAITFGALRDVDWKRGHQSRDAGLVFPRKRRKWTEAEIEYITAQLCFGQGDGCGGRGWVFSSFPISE